MLAAWYRARTADARCTTRNMIVTLARKLLMAPSTWGASLACAGAPGWVVEWDDDTRSRPLHRLSVPS
jgi:hypothetical protein